jgi:hypothetical protein
MDSQTGPVAEASVIVKSAGLAHVGPPGDLIGRPGPARINRSACTTCRCGNDIEDRRLLQPRTLASLTGDAGTVITGIAQSSLRIQGRTTSRRTVAMMHASRTSFLSMAAQDDWSSSPTADGGLQPQAVMAWV